jgi:hypothetical protein
MLWCESSPPLREDSWSAQGLVISVVLSASREDRPLLSVWMSLLSVAQDMRVSIGINDTNASWMLAIVVVGCRDCWAHASLVELEISRRRASEILRLEVKPEKFPERKESPLMLEGPYGHNIRGRSNLIVLRGIQTTSSSFPIVWKWKKIGRWLL